MLVKSQIVVLSSTYDLQCQHPKAENVHPGRHDASECIFRSHIATVERRSLYANNIRMNINSCQTILVLTMFLQYNEFGGGFVHLQLAWPNQNLIFLGSSLCRVGYCLL